MNEIWTMGELLVEVMRPKAGMSLGRTGVFLGPFPSGAPGIFIDAAARLGHSATIVSGAGEDDFGRSILDRLRRDGEVPAFRVREVDPTGAGDCFDAGFLCGLLEGRSLQECARLAALLKRR
jgi:sugar/nucleoside kinase (ribokinase family)